MIEPRKGPRMRGNESPMSKKRIAAKMTQGQLAAALGCRAKDVCRWERGVHAPSAETVAKIAAVLGCSIEEIL